MLRDGGACGPSAVRFSFATRALVLRWLAFKHSYGGPRDMYTKVVWRQDSRRILAVARVRGHVACLECCSGATLATI